MKGNKKIHSQQELFEEAGKITNVLNKKRQKTLLTTDEDQNDDSSDEELVVRSGNVPREWYKGYRHLGYDIDAKKVIKPQEEDEVEKFLKKANDKNWWRNIYDEMNNKTIYISEKDIELINRIRKNLFASKSAEQDEYFENDIPYQIHPVSNHLPSKRAFQLSKNERKAINRLVYLYQNGFMSLNDEEKDTSEVMYDLWTYETTDPSVYHPGKGYQAPKRELPETLDSYNPPSDITDRKPIDAMRKIPKYEKLLEEELDRCCDLFISSRFIKKKLDIKEEDLLPELPKPEELKPFPTKVNIVYRGHESSVRAIAVDPRGKFLLSGDNAGYLHFWDIQTAKILKRIDIDDKILNIVCNSSLNLVTVCGSQSAYFIVPPYLEKKLLKELVELITTKIYPLIKQRFIGENNDSKDKEVKNDAYVWKIPKKSSKKEKSGIVFYMKWKQGSLENIVWHNKGDYFATLSKNSLGKTQVYIHSLSKLIHQIPFSKIKGNVNTFSFHPNKPYFIVATNSNIYVYNLQKQELVRKFVSNLNTITHVSVHKSGNDIITGSKDGVVAWFQLELSDKPYKVMDYHQDKIKAVSFHNNYPLFYSCSRNGKLLVYHAGIREDAMQDPTIVPLKVLKSSYSANSVLTSACFHGKEPWIFTSGEDNLIRLWS